MEVLGMKAEAVPDRARARIIEVFILVVEFYFICFLLLLLLLLSNEGMILILPSQNDMRVSEPVCINNYFVTATVMITNYINIPK